MKGFALTIACFLFVGCSNAQAPVELAGQKFCVPEKHVVRDVPWVEPDGRSVRKSAGVAINNCLIGKLPGASLSKSGCLFPRTVGTVGIEEDSGFRSELGGVGYEESVVGRVLTARNTTNTIADDGQLLMTENPLIWRDWYVWHRTNGQFVAGSRPTAGKDELLVSCSETKTRMDSPDGEFRHAVTCNRKLFSDDLAISYSFESASKIPSLDVVSRLDEGIVSGLDKLRCQ